LHEESYSRTNHTFQTHSRRVALEWIERLRALIAYWQQRHRIDARGEMDLAQSFRPPLTPPTLDWQDDNAPPQAPADPAAPLPTLSRLYNWCVMKGCKPVMKGGKLFARRGLYGTYKSVLRQLIFLLHTDVRLSDWSKCSSRQDTSSYSISVSIHPFTFVSQKISAFSTHMSALAISRL
jgi:hypothetical protein